MVTRASALKAKRWRRKRPTCTRRAQQKYLRKRSVVRQTIVPNSTGLLKIIDAGDVVIVTRLDRLARSTRDLLNILDKIARAGATFKSLGDAWADTTTAHGRLMLTVLGGLAEFERELIRVRTGEGRVRAKARGVHMGRPFKLNRDQRREAIARRETGEALTDIARTFGVHHTTIGRLRA
jgi:DNA invertase Pin-like site-specific DNA recombinase